MDSRNKGYRGHDFDRSRSVRSSHSHSHSHRKSYEYCTEKYDPIAAGSKDKSHQYAYDRGLIRAINSKYNYKSKESKKEKSDYTLFVGRLPKIVSEEDLSKKFSKYGSIKYCKIVYDIVTGESKGYGFIKYKHKSDSIEAYKKMNKSTCFNGKPIIVDWRACKTIKEWKPRRLGGGWGGDKTSGQLRFGCRDRPWVKED